MLTPSPSEMSSSAPGGWLCSLNIHVNVIVRPPLMAELLIHLA